MIVFLSIGDICDILPLKIDIVQSIIFLKRNMNHKI